MSHPFVFVFGLALGAFVVWRRRRLEPTLLVGGGLVATAALLIGIGVVPLPNVEAIIEEIGQRLGKWTYLFVAVFAFLETGAFVGLLAPGETVVIVGGVVAGQGRIDLLTLIGLTWACAVAGDVVSLLLGRKLGRGFLERHGHRVAITEERLQDVERFFERYGGRTILVGRFLGLVRALAPFIAGASKMPLRRFLPYDIVAAGVWATTFCVLGYVFWRSIDQVTRYAGTGAFALGTIVTLVVVALFFRRLARDREYRGRVRRWVCRRPGGERFLRAAEPVLSRAVGPVRFLWHRVTPGDLGLELTTLLALGAVGAFTFVYLGGASTGTLDRSAFDVADALRSGTADEIVPVFTDLGASRVVGLFVAVTVVWALLRGQRVDAAMLAIGALVLWVLVGAAKDAYGVPRPTGPMVDAEGLSYPSGHAAYGVALIGCALVLVRGGAGWAARFALVAVAVVAAAGIAMSRVYLRVHFASDVLGGIGLGLAVLAACGILALLVGHLRHNERPDP